MCALLENTPYAKNSFTLASISARSTPTSPASTASITRLSAIVCATLPALNHTRPFNPIAVSNGMCAASAGRSGSLGVNSLV